MIFSFLPRVNLLHAQDAINFQVPVFIWVILGILLLSVILGLILGEKMSEDRQLSGKEGRQIPAGIIPRTGRETARESDFILLHGIDRDTQMALYSAGIRTFEDLARSTVHDLGSILFPHPIKSVVLASWAGQAEMAAAGRWAELQDWQTHLRENAG